MNRQDDDLERLAELGVRGILPAGDESIEIPPAPVGHGYAGSSAVTLDDASALEQLAGDFRVVSPAWARATETRLEVHGRRPHFARITRARPFQPLPLTATAGTAVRVDDDDPCVVYVDFEQARRVWVPTGERRGVVLQWAATGTLESRSYEPEADVELPATPVLGWLADCRDSWMRATVSKLVARGDAYSVAVAAGTYACYFEPAPGQARSWLEDWARGTTPLEARRPRAWARCLSERQIEHLEDLAVAEVELMLSDMPFGARAATSSGAADRECRVWQHLAVRRAQLEAAGFVLDAGGAGARLWDLFPLVDEAGGALSACLALQVREGIARGDEWLRRAALRDPGSWWSGDAPLSDSPSGDEERDA